jgi:putative endonuclease
MALWAKLTFWKSPQPALHLARGALGENAAREFLEAKGLKFLTANFAGRRGEIDLIFRTADCLIFVEVKTRSENGWTRPSRAVTATKRRALFRTAADYLRLLDNPQVAYRFDIIEVLLNDGVVREVRHIENAFDRTMLQPRRRG